MEKFSRSVWRFVWTGWFAAISGFSSIAGFVWFLYDKYTESQSALGTILFSVSVFLFVISFLWTILIRSENKGLRSLSKIFFEMDEIYRDKLRDFFCPDTPFLSAEELVTKEKEVLFAICQRVENIYFTAIGKPCLVTIKLTTVEEGRCYSHTYVRSQSLCPRDKDGPKKYSVGTGDNTAFDYAMAKRRDGKPSHFFSSDLEKERAPYHNERLSYLSYYRSAIIVPIRGVNSGKEGTQNEFDMVGFLCVDTLSRNRLNDGFHVYMLSAISCEIYNFMNLMRGKYEIVNGGNAR
jgi:hypothetical protein